MDRFESCVDIHEAMIVHPTHAIDRFAGMLDTSLLNDMAQAETMTISKLMVGTCARRVSHLFASTGQPL